MQNKKVIIVLLLIFSVFSISSCNKKNENNPEKSDTKNKSGSVSELIKTDDKGQRANLKLQPKVGDLLRYKMIAKTNSSEKSVTTNNKEVLTGQEMVYFYTQEVIDVSESGYVTYKMKYDSIMITTKLESGDSTQTEVYNSNIKDDIHSKIDFVQYNALIGQYFKFRISPKGEIADVYELEKVHEGIFKALGDTLKPEDKSKIKESMGSDALKSIIQNQFQKFPEQEIYKDSTWSFSNETNLSIFPVKNILTYKLKDIQQSDKGTILEIEATLGIDFLKKEAREGELSIKVVNSEAGGEGTVKFNLTRGCVEKKETKTNIDMDMKLSARGQSAKSKQTLKTNLIVELL